jgi:predicted amidohydrolase
MSSDGAPLARRAPRASVSVVKIAALQMTSGEDCAANMAAAQRLIEAAAAAGAQLCVLPEKWPLLGRDQALLESARPLEESPALALLSTLARRLCIELIAGSLLERRADGRIANTSVHIDREGEIVAAYRKIHMFDVQVQGRSYHESAVADPGSEIVLSESAPGAKLGMTICYDLRFPELYRILAIRGAQIIAVPAAFTYPTTRDHWEVLLRARAIENGCYVIGANQIGEHPGGLRSGGRSAIVDPWGVVLASAPDRECFISAELDLGALEELRASMPTLANRRPQAYAWPEAQLRRGA